MQECMLNNLYETTQYKLKLTANQCIIFKPLKEFF